MRNLTVFTFRDANGNSMEFTAPSKSQASKMAKRVMFGGGALRYHSERPETDEERKARRLREKNRREQVEKEEATKPKILRRRKAAGRNDRCPCGSGRKVKHCCGADPSRFRGKVAPDASNQDS